MPVKRRQPKRRIDPAAEFAAWCSILESGHDYFRELPAFGVGIDEYDRPDREAAREAWSRYGAQILAERDPRVPAPWALTEFGAP